MALNSEVFRLFEPIYIWGIIIDKTNGKLAPLGRGQGLKTSYYSSLRCPPPANKLFVYVPTSVCLGALGWLGRCFGWTLNVCLFFALALAPVCLLVLNYTQMACLGVARK